MEGYATKRVGKEHSKWQAGTLCGYKNLPSITINMPVTDAEVREACPRNILHDRGGQSESY